MAGRPSDRALEVTPRNGENCTLSRVPKPENSLKARISGFVWHPGMAEIQRLSPCLETSPKGLESPSSVCRTMIGFSPASSVGP